MSDGEQLSASASFTRGCRARASLPAARTCSHTRQKPPGVLFLQYGGETKQVIIPAEISSEDSLRALFVTAFPHQLNRKMVQPPNMAICIRDANRNLYYDLEDLRDITPNSCLKAYHKDPAHVFHPHAKPANTEGMISKEMLYGSHSPIHRKASSTRSALQSLQGSMSPPMVRSMPSSPSRMAYGGGGSHGKKAPGSATMPRECQPGRGRSSTAFSSSSSAILERRDVKPDGDVGTSTALVLHGDGGSAYPEYYRSLSVDAGGGRHSSSSYCSSPPMLTGGRGDAGPLGIPGGLQQYRATVKPLMGYGDSMEHQANSVHRQKNRKYGDSHLLPMGIKSPPTPQRGVRMLNGQVIGGASQASPPSMSPVHRSLERNSSGFTVDGAHRGGSSSSTSSVFLDSPLAQPEALFPTHITTCNTQSERMKAMEEQIASLAGLVHHALSMGSEALGPKETISQSAEHKLLNNRLGEKFFSGASSDSEMPTASTGSFIATPRALMAPPLDSGLRQNLMSVRRNICELRLQLSQLKCLQLSSLESVSSMLRMAGPELVMLMCEKLAQFEDAAYRQRSEMDEDRIHYLTSEERILTQLSELEEYVETLESSPSVPGQPSLTLRDVEEGAVSLRRLGEALAGLKGEFPVLQAKMRSVLRLEVEAVRFLKEEPHKMDSMLKRVKVLTEALSSLRRRVSDSTPSTRSARVEPVKALNQGAAAVSSPHASPKPQPRHSVKAPPTGQTEVSSAAAASPIIARRTKSTVTSDPPGNSPPTGRHGLDSATRAKNTPRASPEGGLSVDIRSLNQSGSSQDAQLASSDPSPVQSAHGSECVWVPQEKPHMSAKSVANILESRDESCDSASGKKSPHPSRQNVPEERTHAGKEADSSDPQKDASSKQSDGDDSKEKRSSNTAPVGVSDPRTENSRRPQVEKPRRSTDKRQASKSSPPQQRSADPLTSGQDRSGEPVIISSKEPDGIQSSSTSAQRPHSKPQRCPCGSQEGGAEVLQQPIKNRPPHADSRTGL